MLNNSSMQDMQFFEALKKRVVFPLHLHWDGSIPAEHLFRMAKVRGQDLFLPDKDVNGCAIRYGSDVARMIKSSSQLEKVLHGLRKYDLVQVFSYATRFMQTREDLALSAHALCDYLRSQNVRYAEARFAPQYHTFAGLDMARVVDYAVEGFKAGKVLSGVDVRLIIAIGREVGEDKGLEVADVAMAANEKYPEMVLGIDLACEERGNPPKKHLKAFARTFDTPLFRTVHAGEMCGERDNLDNVKSAVYDLRADGVSHAIPLCRDQRLIDVFVKHSIRLASNPLSNAFLFGKNVGDLHLDELVDAGVLVTVNPDDPAMIKEGDLVHNLYCLGKLYGGRFIDRVIGNSVEAAWGLSGEEKAMYRSFVETFKY